MTVLIPIAHRLGLYKIKGEMEDLCLKYSKPDVYQDILDRLNASYAELHDSLDEMEFAISEMLMEQKFLMIMVIIQQKFLQLQKH